MKEQGDGLPESATRAKVPAGVAKRAHRKVGTMKGVPGGQEYQSSQPNQALIGQNPD